MNTNKTVSIIMGTYNGAEYIREQLDSILSQTYPLKEIIIQDDGSTDDTVAICTAYAEKFPIIHFAQCRQPGIQSELQVGCDEGNGRFCGFQRSG